MLSNDHPLYLVPRSAEAVPTDDLASDEPGTPTFETPVRAPMSPRPAATLPDLLAPERSLQTASFDEAFAACATSFQYERAEITLAQVSLDDDLTVRCNGRRYQPTEKGLDDLGSVLKIPTQFAHTIPTDLLATIVGRLKQDHARSVVLVTRDDVLVGVVDPLKWTGSRARSHPPQFRPVTGVELLRMVQTVWPHLDDALQITLADSGVRVELHLPELALEPEVGDVTEVGLAVTTSETGGPLPVARGHTLRLVCTNGATLPEAIGLTRFSSDWRVALDRRLAAFEAGLRALTLDIDLLRAAYARLVGDQLTDQGFYNLHRAVGRVYRHAPRAEGLADRALGVTPEQRRAIVSHVRRRQVALRLGDATELDPARPTPIRAWDAFNAITAVAREEPYQRRSALERIAGGLLRTQPSAGDDHFAEARAS